MIGFVSMLTTVLMTVFMVLIEDALPLSSFPSRDEPERHHTFSTCISLLDDHKENGGGVYDVYVAQAEKCPKDEARDKCRLIMDICSTDIRKYKIDVEKYRGDYC